MDVSIQSCSGHVELCLSAGQLGILLEELEGVAMKKDVETVSKNIFLQILFM